MIAPVTYRRIQHAAHYMYGDPRKGHDLETWDVIHPFIGHFDGVPADANYQYGYVDDAGVQHWVFTRVAPLTGSCEKCEAA